MKKILLTLLVLCLGFASVVTSLQAQRIPTLTFFHGATCPHCHNEKKWFPELKQMYPDLQINEYEVWNNPENKALFEARMRELGQEAGGVPTNVIGEEVIVGFNKSAILAAMEKNYGAPVVSADETSSKTGLSVWQKIRNFFQSLF